MNDFQIIGAMRRLELMRRIRDRKLLLNCGLHPGQPPIVGFVDKHPGCSQKDVATELDISAASAASSIKRLEKAGMIVRKQDETDTRKNLLFVTALGHECQQKAEQGFTGLNRAMLSGIEENELETYKKVCEKMFENLADESTRNLNICRLHQAADDILKNKDGE